MEGRGSQDCRTPGFPGYCRSRDFLHAGGREAEPLGAGAGSLADVEVETKGWPFRRKFGGQVEATEQEKKGGFELGATGLV